MDLDGGVARIEEVTRGWIGRVLRFPKIEEDTEKLKASSIHTFGSHLL